MAQAPAGVCPHCDAPGPVGAACASERCRRAGYHFIPSDDARAQAAQPDPAIGTYFGNYLIVGIVGSGGFGKVYLALQQPIGMRTALKIIRREALPPTPGEGPDPIARFELEARALGRLSHPNIVRLLNYGVQGGSPFMVMELVDHAHTLKHEIIARAAAEQELGLDEIRHLLAQLLSGLQAAHDADLIHRDLKPENLMLQARRGEPPQLKIIDFGLAKDIAESSESQFALGTVAYMAPEQIRRRELGPWTDLYAVGAIAFELMTGYRVFCGDTSQIVSQKLDPSFEPVSAAGAHLDLPGPVCDFFVRALAADPKARFRDIATFRSALEAALNDLGTTETSVNLTGLVTDPPTKIPRQKSREHSRSAALANTLAGTPGAVANTLAGTPAARAIAARSTPPSTPQTAAPSEPDRPAGALSADRPPLARRTKLTRGLVAAALVAAALAAAAVTTAVVATSAPPTGTPVAVAPTAPPPTPTPSPSDPSGDVALIISIEDYAFLPHVPGADANGRAWLDWFTRERKLRPERVKWLRNADGTPNQIKRAAAQMADLAAPGSTAWVIFIGHGAPTIDQADGVLVGVSAQQAVDEFYAQSVPQSALMASLAHGRQAHNVVLIDACFNGRAPDGTLLASGTQPALLNDQPGPLPAQTTLFTAGTSREFAGALPGVNRPAFSYLALAALGGAADQPPYGDGNGAITGDEVLAYARGTLVSSLSGRSQTPQGYGETARVLVERAAPGAGATRATVETGATRATGATGAALPKSGLDLDQVIAAHTPPPSPEGTVSPSVAAPDLTGQPRAPTEPVFPTAPEGAIRPPDLGFDLSDLKRSDATWSAILATQEVVLDDTVPGAERRAAAWDKVASLAAHETRSGAATLVTYARKEAARWHDVVAAAPRMHADWVKVRELLGLASVPSADKRLALDKFRAAYQVLGSEWDLADAQAAAEALSRGHDTPIGPANALASPASTSTLAPSLVAFQIPAGTPTPGSPRVASFWLAAPATQADWRALFGTLPSTQAACTTCPISHVTYAAAAAYLNLRSLLAGRETCYRLRACTGDAALGTLTCGDLATRPACRGLRFPSAAERDLAERTPSPSDHPSTPRPYLVERSDPTAGPTARPAPKTVPDLITDLTLRPAFSAR